MDTRTLPTQTGDKVVDFLAAFIRTGEAFGAPRRGFRLDRPWMRLHFGVHRLRRGWWALECQGDVPVCGIEARLSSPGERLIQIAGHHSGASNLYIPADDDFQVSLLISPWPGTYSFKRLQLRKLGLGEEASFLAAAASQLVRRDKPLARLSNALHRFVSHRPVGVRIAAETATPPAPIAEAARAGRCAGGISVVRAGDLAALTCYGDQLHPRAFEIAAAELAATGARAVYADIREGSCIAPAPEWDVDAAPWWDFASGPVFLRGEAPAGAASPFEMLKEIVASTGPDSVRRIALPLASRTAAFARSTASVPRPRLTHTPRVSIVIPTKFRVDLLGLCLDGLMTATDYPDLEVIIVDNGCRDPDFPALLERASAKLSLKRIEDFGAFNFARLVNAGVAASTGEIVLLLNDDVQPQQPDWLLRLVETAMDPAVGAVGPRLVYPDGSVQHAGVVLGFGGTCGHIWRGLPQAEAELMPQVMLPSTKLAVTGACLAVRRSAYDAVRGLDAAAFPVTFNDIDFCLRLRAAGLRNVYRGDAVLVHHESQSRGADSADDRRRRRLANEAGRFMERWRDLLDNDPFSSPAFDPSVDIGRVHRSLNARWP